MTFSIDGASVVITGGNTGIGLETAVALAAQGARVTFTSRDAVRGEAARQTIRARSGNDDVRVVPLDLASLASVREAADTLLARDEPIQVLVNNAGVAVFGRRRETADGFERQFGVNHLGHMLLTQLLIDRMRESAPARVVVVSSAAYGLARDGMRWHDLQWQEDYDGWQAYGQSKLANLYFTWELADRVAGRGITVNALHPGFVATELGYRRPEEQSSGGSRPRTTASITSGSTTVDISAIGPPKTAADGARTSVMLASDPALQDTTGAYFDDDQHRVELAGVAVDRAEARRLWDVSEALIASLSAA
jgi:retinol dehydrogenase-13